MNKCLVILNKTSSFKNILKETMLKRAHVVETVQKDLMDVTLLHVQSAKQNGAGCVIKKI